MSPSTPDAAGPVRRLVLLRHAATEPGNPGGDKARELLPEGVDDARRVGRRLVDLGLEHALVSSAVRTRQTFDALGLDIGVEFQDALYHGAVDTMLGRIAETDDAVTGLLVVGHAPTIPGLAARLSFASDPRAADDLQCSFPTGTWVELTFSGAWSDLDPDSPEGFRFRGIHRIR